MTVSEFSPPAMEPGKGAAYLKYLLRLDYKLGVVQRSLVIAKGGDVSAVMRAYEEKRRGLYRYCR